MENIPNIGFFRLVDKKSNKILKKYDYNKISAKERKEMKDTLSKNPNLKIYCDCTNEDIELKIASNLVIYNYQRNIGERHHPNCPKYKDTDLVAWTYSQKEKAYKAGSYNTAQDYIVKLNTFLYQDNHTKNINDSLKNIKSTAFKIITFNNVKLGYIINQNKILDNKDYFVYGYLGMVNRKNIKNQQFVEITCIIEKEPELKTIKILADFNAFNTLYSENRYYTLPENKKPLLVGGWFNKENNQFFFTDFWLKAVDNTGKIF